MARVVCGVPATTNSSPGRTDVTSSSVAPQEYIHGRILPRYPATRPAAAIAAANQTCFLPMGRD